MAIRLVERPLTVGEYASLREAVGWWPVDPETTARGLGNSLYTVCLVDGEELIGCGRITGDDGIYFEIHDVIVLPPWRGRGLGSRIMEVIMGYIADRAGAGTTVSLLAAEGVHLFYERLGFEVRPGSRPGMILRI